jgi:hypothetical protein
MANKYTALPIPTKLELETLYMQNLTQSEIGERFGTTQKVVYSWFKKLGIKSRVPVKRNQIGENNSSWKGNKATYSALHHRVEVARGKPHYCSVCGTMDASVYEWANLTGKYEDVMDYARMCRKCHRKYDKNRPQSSKHVNRKAK